MRGGGGRRPTPKTAGRNKKKDRSGMREPTNYGDLQDGERRRYASLARTPTLAANGN